MISIVIPVYNSEQYLRQCVDSVLAQTYKNLDVILVDDGSTDSSPAICDEYAARDVRVRVIHQENGGIGAARNAGIKIAKGTYIGFVDSDDWIDPLMYEYMYEKITRTQSDIAICGYTYEYRNRSEVKQPVPAPAVYQRTEALKMLFENKLVQGLSCDKLFRRTIVAEDLYSEDRTFFESCALMLRWFARAERFAIDAVPFYHYRMRLSGRLNSSNPQAYYEKLTAVIEQNSYIKNNLPLLYPESRLSAMVISSAVSAAENIVRYCPDDSESYDFYYRIREVSRPFLETAVNNIDPTTLRRYIRLLNSIPSFCRRVKIRHMLDFAGRRTMRGCFD